MHAATTGAWVGYTPTASRLAIPKVRSVTLQLEMLLHGAAGGDMC